MVDTYTKVCLTVIAVSLAVIGFRGLPMIDPAYAQGGVQKIALCDENGSRCASVKPFYGKNFMMVTDAGSP